MMWSRVRTRVLSGWVRLKHGVRAPRRGVSPTLHPVVLLPKHSRLRVNLGPNFELGVPVVPRFRVRVSKYLVIPQVHFGQGAFNAA